MNLAEHIVSKQRAFEVTGNFISEQPVVVAPLSEEVFLEASSLDPETDSYRQIGVEGQTLPALTRFRRVTGGHSAAVLQGSGYDTFREEPLLRAGILGARHWTIDGTDPETIDRTITRPHIDDGFIEPSIGYFGIVGQSMLHFPGSYTVNMGRLRDEGFEVSDELLRFWKERENYRKFMFDATGISQSYGFDRQIQDLYEQQIEAQSVAPVESPTDAVFMVDNQFLHSENDHKLAVGEFRGWISRLVEIIDYKLA
jgi:hypothetical protein